MKFTLWIGNPYQIYYPWTALKDALKRLLTPVIDRSTRFDSFEVRNVKSLSHVENTDLLVYIVPSYQHGFIGRGFGPDGCGVGQENESGHGLKENQVVGGFTLPLTDDVCSEFFAGTEPVKGGELIESDWATDGIEVKTRFGVQHAACLIFHEALHNKTGLDDDKLHPHGGLASEVVPILTEPTESDVKLLAGGLDKKHQKRQWVGGFADVASRG